MLHESGIIVLCEQMGLVTTPSNKFHQMIHKVGIITWNKKLHTNVITNWDIHIIKVSGISYNNIKQDFQTSNDPYYN
jgi:hypothetical protein